MSKINFVVPFVVILLATLLMTGCSGEGKAQVENLNLDFGGMYYEQDGQIIITEGDSLEAITTVEYTTAGAIEGEWTIDGEKIAVSLELPQITNTPDDGNADENNEDAISFVALEQTLPSASTGIHTASFTVTSPKTINTDTVEYMVQAMPPPANNPGSYMVEVWIGNGFATRDNEGGGDEFHLWAKISTYDPASTERTLIGDERSSNGFKISPPYEDFNIGDGDSFEWNKKIGGPWEIEPGIGLAIEAALYEIDSGGLLDAVLSVWGTKIGTDDLLDPAASFNIRAEELSEIANGESGGRVYTHRFGPSAEGDVKLEFVVWVTKY